jgi:hypothetical protein
MNKTHKKYKTSQSMQEFPSVKKIFKYESGNAKIGDVVVRELKILDQYSASYERLVSKYKTPKSICGYVASAVGPILADMSSYLVQQSSIEDINSLLRDPSVLLDPVEERMKSIQTSRADYLKKY